MTRIRKNPTTTANADIAAMGDLAHGATLAGAEVGEWQELDGQAFRVLFGSRRPVPGCETVTVGLTAVQLPDGSIDTGAAIEPPAIFLDNADHQLTAEAARELSGLLIEAAAELDALAGNRAGWRALSDRLTAQQMRHLAAVEELAVGTLKNGDVYARATAQETLDLLVPEAVWYAERNATPGLDADHLGQFRELLREVNPAELTTDDLLGVVSLLQRGMGARGTVR